MTEVWTVDDVDLLNFDKVQRDQHVSSSDSLHQDVIQKNSARNQGHI